MKNKDLQKEELSSIYKEVFDVIPTTVLKNKNRAKSWQYGYNQKYDLVVISKTGEVGPIYNISGLFVALPKIPTNPESRSNLKSDQYWERKDLPKQLSRIKSIFQWNDMPSVFKNAWVDYIEGEFDKESKVIG